MVVRVDAVDSGFVWYSMGGFFTNERKYVHDFVAVYEQCGGGAEDARILHVVPGVSVLGPDGRAGLEAQAWLDQFASSSPPDAGQPKVGRVRPVARRSAVIWNFGLIVVLGMISFMLGASRVWTPEQLGLVVSIWAVLTIVVFVSFALTKFFERE
jgi:hypothetical protein